MREITKRIISFCRRKINTGAPGNTAGAGFGRDRGGLCRTAGTPPRPGPGIAKGAAMWYHTDGIRPKNFVRSFTPQGVKKRGKTMKNKGRANTDPPARAGLEEAAASDGVIVEYRKTGPVVKTLKFIAGLFLMLIIAGCIFGAIMTVYVIKYIDPNASIDISGLKQSTMLLTYNDETDSYVETARLYSDENRVWVDIGNIPDHVQKAIVASEDKRFYQHNGVDWIRTGGAALNLVFHFWGKKQGGSTITQQLIKNLLEDNEVSIQRKIREIVRALNLEKTTSKDIILEAYMNTIYLGYSCNGIQSAANFYFGKDVSELTPAEAASIVVITRFPGRNNPLTHPDKNRSAYTYVLKTMFEQGWLTQEEYDEALAQKLEFVGKAADVTRSEIYSWYEDQVITDVLNDLQEIKGYTLKEARRLLYGGGLRIYMAVDQKVQSALEEQYYNEANFLRENKDKQPQSAMVIMNYEGRVLGLVGGKGEKTANRIWNRSTDTTRSPGSSIKPLAVYALAVEKDLTYWSQKIPDAPIELIDARGNPYKWPKNYYSSYKGLITLDYAIQRSTNTVPVRLLQMLTPEVSFDFLYNKLGMHTLAESARIGGNYYSDKGLAPLSMGSLTNGVTVLEMCAAYQIFGGEGGLYTSPYTYTKVEDSHGNVIIEKTVTSTRVISEETAFIMNRLMQRVVTGPNGTGRLASKLGYDVAAKTGTTTDYHDRWFVGLTPYYCGVVWTGYDIPQEMDESLRNPSLDAWLKVMKKIHKDLPNIDFFSSDLVEQREYCTVSGLMASSSCASTAKGWYKRSQFIETCGQCG